MAHQLPKFTRGDRMKSYNLLKTSFLSKTGKTWLYVDGVRVSRSAFEKVEKLGGSACCFSTVITGDKVQQRKTIVCK
jgi:hypothetical protein